MATLRAILPGTLACHSSSDASLAAEHFNRVTAMRIGQLKQDIICRLEKVLCTPAWINGEVIAPIGVGI